MLFYFVGSIIKLIIGVTILLYLYNFINIYQDPTIGLIFGSIGIFVIVWGLSFFVFFLLQLAFSSKTKKESASISYKLSLIFGIYIIINCLLILMSKWTKGIGLIIFIIFIILQIILIKDDKAGG